ncbi:MAG: S8 family serine peptidase [Vicinamibacterales bacterium]
MDAHGTHVSGTIGGAGGNGIGVAGVNWNVRIISAKFLGTTGGTTANAIKAVDYLTDLKSRHDLNIVATNNSWGGGGYSQGLHDAIIRGAKAGILFIAAAGNSATNNDTTSRYPSNYDTTIGTGTEAAASFDAVIAVAALCGSSASSYCSGGAGTLASFSSYGATTVDLAAPGVSVYSTTPGNRYSSYSGTSMATPHVTGAAALYASIDPTKTADEIKEAILTSTTPTASLADETATGGRLNIGAWFGSTGGPAPDAPSNLTVSVFDADVSLAWDAATDADGSTTYNVLRKLGSGSYSTIALGVSSTSYVDTVPASGTYCYVVQAVKGGESSANSNEVCEDITVPVVPAPAAPTNLVAQQLTPKKQIGLSWTGSSGATSYRIYRKTDTTLFVYIGSVSGTTAVNTGLQSGVTYTYYVTAMSTAESGPSNESSATAR